MTKVSDDLIVHRPIGDIELDPALDVLPLMAADDLCRLVDSISRDGITHPLHVREEGKRVICLDGRNRLKAARECGIETVPCLTVQTDDSLESALGSTINRRRLSKTGIAYFVIKAHPELCDRAGKHDSSTSFADKGRTGVHKMNTHADKGPSIRDLSERYSLHISYISNVIAALIVCRPASRDEEVLCKLIIDDEVCAANLMKALQGWQASHPIGDDANPDDATVTKKAQVDVFGGITKGLTFIRNQSRAFSRLPKDQQSELLSAWHRTWKLLPSEFQAYALKMGKTKDYAVALAEEAALAKPKSLTELAQRRAS